MKTVLKVIGLFVVGAALLGAGQFLGTRAAAAAGMPAPLPLDLSPTEPLSLRIMDAGLPGHPGPHQMPGGVRMLDYRDELEAGIAKGLGMSTADFRAALAAGKTPWQIAQGKGLSNQQLADVMIKAHSD